MQPKKKKNTVPRYSNYTIIGKLSIFIWFVPTLLCQLSTDSFAAAHASDSTIITIVPCALWDALAQHGCSGMWHCALALATGQVQVARKPAGAA